MARFAGFAPGMALYIATATQYMDESMVTSPLEINYKNERVLRLFHFGVPYQSHDSNIVGLNFKVPSGVVVDPNIPTIRNTLMSNQMIWYGISKRDLLLAVSGLHTLEDSFSHSGHWFGVGHDQGGHWPDRFYYKFNGKKRDKFKNMTRTVFKALVGIRGLFDCQEFYPLTTYCPAYDHSNKNWKLDAAELAEKYMKLPGFEYIENHYILKDPEYIDVAVRNMIERAKKDGFIDSRVSFDQLKPFFPDYSKQKGLQTEQYDAIDALQVMLTNAVNFARCNPKTPKLFHEEKLALINVDYGDLLEPKPCGSPIDAERVEEIIIRLALHYIPIEPDDVNKAEFEDDKAITRITEMRMRNRQMALFIAKNFGESIRVFDRVPIDNFELYGNPNVAAPSYLRKPMTQILEATGWKPFSVDHWNEEMNRLVNAGTLPKAFLAGYLNIHFSDYGLFWGKADQHAKIYQNPERLKSNLCRDEVCPEDKIPFPITPSWEVEIITNRLKQFINKVDLTSPLSRR